MSPLDHLCCPAIVRRVEDTFAQPFGHSHRNLVMLFKTPVSSLNQKSEIPFNRFLMTYNLEIFLVVFISSFFPGLLSNLYWSLLCLSRHQSKISFQWRPWSVFWYLSAKRHWASCSCRTGRISFSRECRSEKGLQFLLFKS